MVLAGYGKLMGRGIISPWSQLGRSFGDVLKVYADDTVIVTTSMDDMQELLQRLEAENSELGLTINKSKTKLMFAYRAEKLAKSCTIPSVEVLEEYRYTW